jgi:hypothetical protein
VRNIGICFTYFCSAIDSFTVFRKILSLVLLVVFFIETTPDDLWHVIAAHEDTRDISSAETILSTHHIHCDCLKNSLPAFHFQSADFITGSVYVVNEICCRILQHGNHTFDFPPSGRAPPLLT